MANRKWKVIFFTIDRQFIDIREIYDFEYLAIVLYELREEYNRKIHYQESK